MDVITGWVAPPDPFEAVASAKNKIILGEFICLFNHDARLRLYDVPTNKLGSNSLLLYPKILKKSHYHTHVGLIAHYMEKNN